MIDVSNLGTNLGGYFKFVMAEIGLCKFRVLFNYILRW